MSPVKLSPAEARRQRDAFKRKVGAIVKANDKIFKKATGEAFKYIRDLRSDIRNAIIGAEGFELRHLRSIRDELDAAGARLADRFNASMSVHQGNSWELGGKMVDEGFAAAKIDVALPMLSDAQLIAVKDYTADLITNMASQTIEEVSGHVRRGIVAGENPYKTMKRIETVLLKKKKGTFWRAEKIVRTEQGRVFNIANQERMGQAREQIPDLQKQWVTGPDVGPEAPRAAHRAANGQIRDADKPFDVGGEALDFPGDPKGRPENVISCRCVSIPFRKAWGE